MTTTKKPFSRTREFNHVYEEAIEQLDHLMEYDRYVDGYEVSTEFYHMTPSGATYYVNVAIQDGECTAFDVWRMYGISKERDDVYLGNVSALLGDTMQRWGLNYYLRENERRHGHDHLWHNTPDPAFGSWAEVNSMFI